MSVRNAEAVDLTGWPTDGPAATPATPATPRAPSRPRPTPPAPGPPATPRTGRAQPPRTKAAPAPPAAPRDAAVTDDASADRLDLGLLRRRARPATAQLSCRIAPELKQTLDRTAAALGVPAVEVLEALLSELDPGSEAGLIAAHSRVLTHLLEGLPPGLRAGRAAKA